MQPESRFAAPHRLKLVGLELSRLLEMPWRYEVRSTESCAYEYEYEVQPTERSAKDNTHWQHATVWR